ncbi:L,D-transpeptidase [Rubrivivax gelatinosus]|nr:L,D-transpeptidase [Rubrivivax gelatinosus]
MSPDAAALVEHVRRSGDAGGRPWAVVDKTAASLMVFGADGRLLARTPVLLGLARGDDSAPGVGARAARVPPAERTTAAGRFAAEPGRNLNGEGIVWLDYDAALAIHRLRPAPAAERRAERLASPTPADNRISAGCIVVDAGFYDRVVAPLLGRGRSVVYVLPETRGWRTLFATDA